MTVAIPRSRRAVNQLAMPMRQCRVERAADPSFPPFPIAGVTHQLYAPDTSGPAWTTAVLHFRRHLGPPEAVRWRHAALPQGSARSVLARSRKASAMMVKVQLEWPLVGNTLLLTM